MRDGCRLFLVTPTLPEPADFAPRLAAALDGGDVAAVRLRLAPGTDDAALRAIDLLRPVAQSRDVALILAGSPGLAVRSGCDGAHLAAADGGVAEARALLGELQLGVSCRHSRDAAMVAGELGADYVAYGPFFPSPAGDAATGADPALLRWWSELMELPVVAGGGITPGNCAPLVQAGADFLAVAGAVWDHPDGPAAGVRAMNAAIAGR